MRHQACTEITDPVPPSFHYGINESHSKNFFDFLCAVEFTVNFTFDPEINLSVHDLHVDCLINPLSLKIHIKCSKTHLFRSGCDIFLGKFNYEICLLAAIGSYLHVPGYDTGLLFLFQRWKTFITPNFELHSPTHPVLDWLFRDLLWVLELAQPP